jgi:hypothetical protein
MLIADEPTQLALEYVAAATRYGNSLSKSDFLAFADHPGRVQAVTANIWDDQYDDDSWRRKVVQPGESVGDYLMRARWIRESGAAVALTPLGESILVHLNRPSVDATSPEPVSVVIDPKDPLAYVRVFDLISSKEPGLLIDPYARNKELMEINDVPEIERLLISDRYITRQAALMARTLSLMPSAPELRYVAAKELHDRFFIPVTGELLIFGSSLNSQRS